MSRSADPKRPRDRAIGFALLMLALALLIGAPARGNDRAVDRNPTDTDDAATRIEPSPHPEGTPRRPAPTDTSVPASRPAYTVGRYVLPGAAFALAALALAVWSFRTDT